MSEKRICLHQYRLPGNRPEAPKMHLLSFLPLSDCMWNTHLVVLWYVLEYFGDRRVFVVDDFASSPPFNEVA